MIKRSFDIIFSLATLPLILPTLVVISVIIKLDTTGYIFYRGARAGRYGVPFNIYKFRTMVQDAEKIGGGTTALNDSRITRIGVFLRKYKLDELPQIFNVLIGDMSLIGPRPELMEYIKQYKGDELQILSVRPGITDYSSIKFSSLDETVGEKNADDVYEKEVLHEKNQLRIKYVKEQSFMVDMLILLKTIAIMFRKIIR